MTRMVDVRYGSGLVQIWCPESWVGGIGFNTEEARSLYEQLGAVLGALDAETHPKNPEKA